MKKLLPVALLSLSCISGIVQAETKSYTMDLGHAYIGWEAEHLGLSSTRGRFDKFDGTFLIDEKKPEKSAITFTIKTESVNSNHVGRDNHLRKPDFLDTKKHPEITFASTSIKMETDTTGIISGDLTMHGVTAPLELNFTMSGDKAYPEFLPNYDQLSVIGFEAKGVVDRTQHGMTNVSFPGSPIPNEIALDIHFDLVDCNNAPETNIPCNWNRAEGFIGPNE